MDHMHPPERLPYNNYPLEGINHPHAHDVLCGRGGQSNTHPGNTQWRTLVGANKELYVTLPKKQKMWLSQSIVNAVRSQNPPGRFLQKDSNQLWYDVGDKRAQEKTSQALREGAPEIRKNLKTKEPAKDEKDPPKPLRHSSGEQMPPPSDICVPTSSGEQMPPPSNFGVPTISAEQMPPPSNICIPTSSAEQMPPPSISVGGGVPDQVPPPAPKQYRPERVNSIPSDTAPPVFMEHDFSFGSIKLSDNEQQKLMKEGNPQPVDGGLEPVGLSFGSMMSLDKGMSFGSTLDKGMSFGSTLNKILPPDLQDIGTSFGSMSISTNVEKTMPGVATMVRHVKGDLLDCSDTDDEEDDPERKSKEWEKLQAAIANQDAHNAASRQNSGMVMPPTGGPSPYYPPNNQYTDYGMAPPPQMKKGDDWVDEDDQQYHPNEQYHANEHYRLAQQTFPE